MDKKVIFIVAFEGYNQTEYEKPKKILQDAGIQVITASTKPGFALAKDGSTAKVDLLIDKIDPAAYDGVFVIGGPGVPDSLYNDAVYSIIQQFNMAGKPIGAICHGTRVLAKAGALVSRNATGWNGDGKLPEIYREHGVIFEDVPYLIDAMDKRVVTAKGPQEAEAFGHAILEIV